MVVPFLDDLFSSVAEYSLWEMRGMVIHPGEV